MTQGTRQLVGPLAHWWVTGMLLAVLVKVLGIQVGGVVSLLGMLLLSAWLPAMVARSNHERWQASQFWCRWSLLLGTALWWLPLGWFGYLATLQASLQLPATVQNVVFNTRYDWLPLLAPLWLLGWLVSWKWLPALQQQLLGPASWHKYWRTGWRTSWWMVVKQSRNVWLFLISWLVMAIVGIGIVWVSGTVSQLLSRLVAVCMMIWLQLIAWLGLMGWWSRRLNRVFALWPRPHSYRLKLIHQRFLVEPTYKPPSHRLGLTRSHHIYACCKLQSVVYLTWLAYLATATKSSRTLSHEILINRDF